MESEKLLAAFPSGYKVTLWDKIVTVMYWAIVTVATCGYGDISPGTTGGRIMVIVVLYLSIASVSLFTANLASALTTKKMMERRGIMNLNELSDHYVICGWKNGIANILSEILFHSPKLDLSKVVIIANVEPDTIELFNQQYPDYHQISILRGEQYNETLLHKACVAQAAKVLILADESSVSSATEIDSKTVMTAMSIRAISQNVRMYAELLDVKFEKYLKSAHVEEIIYTNEYNKVLIANSFTQVGVTKFINELLDVHVNGFLATEVIPSQYFGKNYSELRDYFKTENDYLLIGLLENVGSFLERKNEALREAQKTADVTKLIDNLKTAKQLENNLPNVNPPDSYVIPKNAMAVLMGRERAQWK